MRILVIEDDDDIRSVCERVFTWAGHEVAAALDATRGLALVDSFAPDVIALDLMMPGIDGLTVLAALRGSAATRRHPRRDRLGPNAQRGPGPGVRGRRGRIRQQAVRPGRAPPGARTRAPRVSRGTGRRATGEDRRVLAPEHAALAHRGQVAVRPGATSTSLPSASARVHHSGACSSLTMWPPAASAAATRASAWSCGT